MTHKELDLLKEILKSHKVIWIGPNGDVSSVRDIRLLADAHCDSYFSDAQEDEWIIRFENDGYVEMYNVELNEFYIVKQITKDFKMKAQKEKRINAR